MVWSDVPPIRQETHFGRLVRCFAERPGNLAAMFAATVARHRARDAIVDGRYRLDYAKLDRVTDRVAGHLHRLGVARGDRVALLLANEREFAQILVAAIKLGAIAVPVNIREQLPELAFILKQCAA